MCIVVCVTGSMTSWDTDPAVVVVTESSLHVGPELSLHAYVVLFVVCVTGSMTSWDTDPAVVVVTESSLHVGPELSVQADVG